VSIFTNQLNNVYILHVLTDVCSAVPWDIPKSIELIDWVDRLRTKSSWVEKKA